MKAELLISVVTASEGCELVYQEVFINDPQAAREAAERYEKENGENIWFITVRDY